MGAEKVPKGNRENQEAEDTEEDLRRPPKEIKYELRWRKNKKTSCRKGRINRRMQVKEIAKQNKYKCAEGG